MDLKNLLVSSKTTWVEFPGLDNFEVELANLSRKELLAVRKRNKWTHLKYEYSNPNIRKEVKFAKKK